MTVSVDNEQRTIHVDDSMSVRELYSSLMDIFDDPEQMTEPVPIQAITPQHFTLVNGWRIGADSEALLIGGALETPTPPPPPPPLPRVYTRKQTLRKIVVRHLL